nr:immunoglobulin light chain junction region [Macaca mulatta]MOX55527.1 immunoglobulin light chain junction region [Macaca mulatta]
LQQYNNWISF